MLKLEGKTEKEKISILEQLQDDLHLQNLPHRPSRMHLQKLRFQLNQPRLQNPQHRQKPQRLPSLPLRQSL